MLPVRHWTPVFVTHNNSSKSTGVSGISSTKDLLITDGMVVTPSHKADTLKVSILFVVQYATSGFPFQQGFPESVEIKLLKAALVNTIHKSEGLITTSSEGT